MNDIQTPCFVLDFHSLSNNIRNFKQALDDKFERNILGYSIKTNSLPGLLDILKESECYAEVVSYDEYNLAILRGFSKKQIIYNGPMKSKETFRDALENGAIVNIETNREIDWLADLDTSKKYQVGIRVNLKLASISPMDCKEEDEFSRFGFSYENGELKGAIERILSHANVKLAGLHLHRTSKTRSLMVYQNICKYALNIINAYSLHLEYIDIGGGYYGDMFGKPAYNDYVNSIYNILSTSIDCRKITLLVEPGNALIASPFSYYSKIIDIKYIDGIKILVSDGTRNDVDPFFHKTDYFKTFSSDTSKRKNIQRQIYVGCTCLENDRLFEMNNAPSMEIGDIVKFSFVGAYTMCFSPLFIRYFPRVYIYQNGKYELMRDEWTNKEYMQLSK